MLPHAMCVHVGQEGLWKVNHLATLTKQFIAKTLIDQIARITHFRPYDRSQNLHENGRSRKSGLPTARSAGETRESIQVGYGKHPEYERIEEVLYVRARS